ncbi:MAG: hypothetical protein J6R42_02715 [Clostridia bacterium]|nr:hypothetical protein [Clostridia bacterium]
MKEKLPRAIQAVLWSVVLLIFAAILVINVVYADQDLPKHISPMMSYGLLYSIGIAALYQTIYRRGENNSSTSYGLKLGAVAVYLVSVTVSLAKLLLL